MSSRVLYSLVVAWLLLGCQSFQEISGGKGSPLVKAADESSLTLNSIAPKQAGEIGFNWSLLRDGTVWTTAGKNSQTNLLYSSIDKGKSWRSVKLPVESLSVGASIDFADSRNGWATGWQQIVRTNDGGYSWERIILPKDSRITDLQTVGFFNASTGLLAGTTGYSDTSSHKSVQGIEILCTEDGGKNLRACFRSEKYNSVFQIVFMSESEAIVFVDGSTLLRTDDRGLTWHETKLAVNGRGISTASDKTLWMVGEGLFQFSRDKGETWIHIEGLSDWDGKPANWNSIGFDGPKFGVAVGDEGIIAVTTNNGRDWKRNKPVSNESLFRVEVEGSQVLTSGNQNLYFLSFK